MPNLKHAIAQVLTNRQKLFAKYYFLRKKPSSIRIDIVGSCNAECPFCPRNFMDDSRKVGLMEFDNFKCTVDKAVVSKISKIKLYITSEPSLHPQFDKFVEYAKHKGLKIYCSTNLGLMHKNMSTFAKVDFLQLSIEGWDKVSYERLRPPLKFEKTLSNLEHYATNYKHAVQYISIHTPLIKSTNVSKFVDIWGKYVDEIRFDFMQPANAFEDGRFVSKVREDLTGDLYDLERKKRDRVCYDPFDEITVGYDGKIHLCCLDFNAAIELGNIFADRIDKIIRNKNLANIKNEFLSQKLSTCHDCSQFYVPTRESIAHARQKIAELSTTTKIVFNY